MRRLLRGKQQRSIPACRNSSCSQCGAMMPIAEWALGREVDARPRAPRRFREAALRLRRNRGACPHSAPRTRRCSCRCHLYPETPLRTLFGRAERFGTMRTTNCAGTSSWRSIIGFLMPAEQLRPSCLYARFRKIIAACCSPAARSAPATPPGDRQDVIVGVFESEPPAHAELQKVNRPIPEASPTASLSPPCHARWDSTQC